MKLSYLLPIIQAAGSAASMTASADDQGLWARDSRFLPQLNLRDMALNNEWYPNQQRRHVSSLIRRRAPHGLQKRGGCIGKQCSRPVHPSLISMPASSSSNAFVGGSQRGPSLEQEIRQTIARPIGNQPRLDAPGRSRNA